jgi:predicted transcriptional regulator
VDRSSRYNLVLGEKIEARLDELAKKEGVSKSAILRRALAVYFYLRQEEAEGRRIAVTEKDGRVMKELVLL